VFRRQNSSTSISRVARVRKGLVRSFVVLSVALLLPETYATATGQSCEMWLARPLSEKNPPTEELLAQSVAVTRVRSLPAGYNGLTLSDSTVLLERDASYRTLLHELAHTHQIAAHGRLAYSASYAWQWYEGRWHGCSVQDARHGISFELLASKAGETSISELVKQPLWVRWEGVLEPWSWALSRASKEKLERSAEATPSPTWSVPPRGTTPR
jgi:hypothetical protein